MLLSCISGIVQILSSFDKYSVMFYYLSLTLNECVWVLMCVCECVCAFIYSFYNSLKLWSACVSCL